MTYRNVLITSDINVAKVRKEGFRKVFNVWTKSHLSNFELG